MNLNDKKKKIGLILTIVCMFILIGISISYIHMPEIKNDKVALPYGNTLKEEQIKLKNAIWNDTCRIDQKSYDQNKIGTQYAKVEISNSLGRKEIRKVKVIVVDKQKPVFTIKNGNNHSNIVYVNVNSNPDISNYISVSDDADGRLNFTSDKKLKTDKVGIQKIKLSAKDTSGNMIEKTYHFRIMDYEAPVIKIKKESCINFGEKVTLNNYYEVKDNYDKYVKVTINGKINSEKLGKQTVEIIATDSSNHKSIKKLSLTIKDMERPKLKLSHSTISIEKGKGFSFIKYVKFATDNKDGNIKDKVKCTSISTDHLGKKDVVFSVTDSSSNTAKQKAVVYVVKKGDIADDSGIIETAKSRLGCPYLYGATGPDKFDCSGFTQWVYKKNHIKIPRTSSAQYQKGKRISINDLRPGDIVWRPGHVGIYVGNGKVIHSPHSGDVVRYTNASGFRCGLRFNE